MDTTGPNQAMLYELADPLRERLTVLSVGFDITLPCVRPTRSLDLALRRANDCLCDILAHQYFTFPEENYDLLHRADPSKWNGLRGVDERCSTNPREPSVGLRNTPFYP